MKSHDPIRSERRLLEALRAAETATLALRDYAATVLPPGPPAAGGPSIGEEAPADAEAARRLARRLFSDWGLQAEDAQLTADGTTATLRGTVAGLPVFNRALTLRFAQDGGVTLDGLWSFGTPYTTVSGSGVACSAADALLEFVAKQPEAASILSMEAGYRMQTDSSRRQQLTPTWKIVTDSGEYLVDCDKKTIVDEEN